MACHMSYHKLSHVISTYHILSFPMLYHDGPCSLSNALFTDYRQLSKATMFPCVPEDDQNFPYMVVQRDTHVPYKGPNVLTVFAKNTTEKGKKQKSNINNHEGKRVSALRSALGLLGFLLGCDCNSCSISTSRAQDEGRSIARPAKRSKDE